MTTKNQQVPQGDDFWNQSLQLEPGLQAIPNEAGEFLIERSATEEKFQLCPWQMAVLGSFSINTVSDSVNVMKSQFPGEIDEPNVRLFCSWLIEQNLATFSGTTDAMPQQVPMGTSETNVLSGNVFFQPEAADEVVSEEQTLEENAVDRILGLDVLEIRSEDETEGTTADESNVLVVDFLSEMSASELVTLEKRNKLGSLIRNGAFKNPVLKVAACFALMLGFLNATESAAYAVNSASDKTEFYIGVQALETEMYFSAAVLPKELSKSQPADGFEVRKVDSRVQTGPVSELESGPVLGAQTRPVLEVQPVPAADLRSTHAVGAGPTPLASPELSNLPKDYDTSLNAAWKVIMEQAQQKIEIGELQSKLDDTLIASEFFYKNGDDRSYDLAVQRIATLSHQIGVKKGIVSPLDPRD